MATVAPSGIFLTTSSSERMWAGMAGVTLDDVLPQQLHCLGLPMGAHGGDNRRVLPVAPGQFTVPGITEELRHDHRKPQRHEAAAIGWLDEQAMESHVEFHNAAKIIP